MSNPTTSAVVRQRGTKKPGRSVRLVNAPGTIPHTADGMLSISTADKPATLYWFAPMPTQLDGRAFSVQQVCCTDAEYHVHVGGHVSCTCLGHLRHGKCKHVSAIAALIAAGKLPVAAGAAE